MEDRNIVMMQFVKERWREALICKEVVGCHVELAEGLGKQQEGVHLGAEVSGVPFCLLGNLQGPRAFSGAQKQRCEARGAQPC